MRKNCLIAIVMVLSMAFLSPIIVNAKSANAVSGSETTGNSNTSSESETSGSESASRVKLQGRSLEKCQKRENAINNVMARIVDRAQKQNTVIESIRQKVQTFYTEKNITISNYDDLIANIEAKKAVATTVMNTVRNMNGTFGCINEDPKGIATQFKSQISVQVAAIKEYKDAVHELVVAIKTALGDSKSATEEN